MRAGSLRHSVTIERPFENRVLGESNKKTYVTYATVFASIRPLNGEERIKENYMKHRVTHEIRMRYIPEVDIGILPTCRINYQGFYFYIEYVINEDYMNRELILRCNEDVKRG